MKIHDLMSELIANYFKTHLGLTQTESANLQKRYYQDYGGSIRGLVLHHKIDALEYNRQVDDALPLDQMLSSDANLRQLLEGIDKSKVKLWLFTNAYKTHGERVVKLLGVKDQFEGMTYCDFAQQPLICKPQPEMFAKAMKEAGVQDVKNCFFIGKLFFLDDGGGNPKANLEQMILR
ncbi:hypothetical protein B7494_g657 [Chlorociboria aeruginascens]|nr:hypothetical protein B7494_g657 [Chlorociboria aeruginascens]